MHLCRSLGLCTVALSAACGSTPAFAPTYALDFGTVDVSSTLTRTLDLQNASGHTVTILSMDVSDLEFTPQQPVPAAVSPGDTLSLAVTFQPFNVGPKSAILTLHTDASDRPTIAVQLAGKGGTACLHLSAEAFDFGNVVIHTTVVRTLTLDNCGDVDLQVTPSAVQGIAASLFSLEGPFPISVPAGMSYALGVAYAPTSPSPQDAAYFILSLTSITPSTPTTITLVGVALQSGFAVNPDHLDCMAPAGSSRQYPLEFKSVGNTVIGVTSVTLGDPGSPAAFSLAAGTWTHGSLAPNDTAEVVVVFAPPVTGNYTGRLAVLFSDGTNAMVPLAGLGF